MGAALLARVVHGAKKGDCYGIACGEAVVIREAACAETQKEYVRSSKERREH